MNAIISDIDGNYPMLPAVLRDTRDCIIKEVQDNEVDVCADVIRRSFATVAREVGITRENYPNDDGMFMKSEALAEERQAGCLMFALHWKNDIIGFIAVYRERDGVWGLGHLSVLPEYRHLGFGSALLDFAKDKIEQSHGHKIKITIIEENKVLRSWYERYGFRHICVESYPDLPFTVGYMELSIMPMLGLSKSLF